jgi:hypothetical protein
MNESASNFYYGQLHSPPRFQWPNECTRDKVSDSLTRTVCEPPVRTQKTECIKANGLQKFVAAISGINRCKTFWVEPVCRKVADEDAQKALINLMAEKDLENSSNASDAIEQEIGNDVDRNERAKDAISRILIQIDVASNLYIGYVIIGLIFSRPLVIFKRSMLSRISGLTFGLTKPKFIILVIALMTMYDAARSFLNMTDVQVLVSNFRHDPCWVDPEFGRARDDIVVKACDEVALLQASTNQHIHVMDDLYFRVKLFGLCEIRNTRSPHPQLAKMDEMRTIYSLNGSRNPALCNISMLNHLTNTPEVALKHRAASSAFSSTLQSGILAQLLVKIVITNVLVHSFAFTEPMGFHNGRVEVLGDYDLCDEEVRAVRRFARDQHLVPLISSWCVLGFEIILFIYAFSHANVSEYEAKVSEQALVGLTSLSVQDADLSVHICDLFL